KNPDTARKTSMPPDMRPFPNRWKITTPSSARPRTPCSSGKYRRSGRCLVSLFEARRIRVSVVMSGWCAILWLGAVKAALAYRKFVFSHEKLPVPRMNGSWDGQSLTPRFERLDQLNLLVSVCTRVGSPVSVECG